MFFNKKTIYLVAKLGEFRILNNVYIKYAFIYNNRDENKSCDHFTLL
jgi:hypothetical protein